MEMSLIWIHFDVIPCQFISKLHFRYTSTLWGNFRQILLELKICISNSVVAQRSSPFFLYFHFLKESFFLETKLVSCIPLDQIKAVGRRLQNGHTVASFPKKPTRGLQSRAESPSSSSVWKPTVHANSPFYYPFFQTETQRKL